MVVLASAVCGNGSVGSYCSRGKHPLQLTVYSTTKKAQRHSLDSLDKVMDVDPLDTSKAFQKLEDVEGVVHCCYGRGLLYVAVVQRV